LKEKAAALADSIKSFDSELSEVDAKLDALLLRVPNIPHETVPKGSPENNKVIRYEGKAPEYDYPLSDHLTLMSNLNLLDMPRGAKMPGSFCPVFKGKGAKLARSLINFMLDIHTNDHGFTEISAPFIASRESMKNTGQLPKLEKDMYHITEDDLFLIPTAEVVLTNFHAEDTLNENDLPVKLVGYTPCFRREAGAYGADTKGLTRLHQFDKIELVLFTKPEESYMMHEKLLSWAEEILKRLGLHYRILLLAEGDLSFSAAKCYDIEVFSPSDGGKWLEVSSCSNFEDFQSRRANIKYRPKGDKVELVHTLNSSGLALPRLIIAIIETFQTKDGKVRIPEALIPYFGSGLIE
jgi:seryl-tRNA synthetase